MTTNQTPLVDLLRLHAEDLYSDYGHNKSAGLLSQAADEIERLRSNSLALEDEKNDYMDGVGDVLGQDHDGETLWAAAQRVMSECDRLRAELASWQEAFGLLTTLHGSVQIDSSDPMGMAKQIEAHVRVEARKPDCRTCARLIQEADGPICSRAWVTRDICVDWNHYEYQPSLVRLYEKEGAA